MKPSEMPQPEMPQREPAQPELPGMPQAATAAAGRSPRARRAAAVSADAWEAALLEALDRPAVRARLADLVQQALGDAVERAGQRGCAAVEAGSGATGGCAQARVLVVGLPPAHGRTLATQVPGGIELRMARPGDDHERLRALARGCTAVVVDEAVAAELEEFLASLQLPTLHHEGSTRRLAQRLAELGEPGAPEPG